MVSQYWEDVSQTMEMISQYWETSSEYSEASAEYSEMAPLISFAWKSQNPENNFHPRGSKKSWQNIC
jgi:hypothetical protein